METVYTPLTYVLAEVGDRLLAKLIDSAVYLVPVLLFFMGGGVAAYTSGGDLNGASLPFLGLGGLLFLGITVYQIVLLSTHGQTIGKRLMKIKIVRVSDQQNGGFVTNVLLRSWVNALLGFVPFYGLVDILFIFSSDRRCLHDLIAGTIVVKPNDEVVY